MLQGWPVHDLRCAFRDHGNSEYSKKMAARVRFGQGSSSPTHRPHTRTISMVNTGSFTSLKRPDCRLRRDQSTAIERRSVEVRAAAAKISKALADPCRLAPPKSPAPHRSRQPGRGSTTGRWPSCPGRCGGSRGTCVPCAWPCSCWPRSAADRFWLGARRSLGRSPSPRSSRLLAPEERPRGHPCPRIPGAMIAGRWHPECP